MLMMPLRSQDSRQTEITIQKEALKDTEEERQHAHHDHNGWNIQAFFLHREESITQA